MTKFVLPKPSRKEMDALEDMVEFAGDSLKRVVFSIPADDKIIKMLKAGENYVVTLEGVVTEVVDVERQGDDGGRKNFDIEVVSVEVKPESEFSKLLDEDE